MHSHETIDHASVAAAIDKRLQDLGSLELGDRFLIPGLLGTSGRVLDEGPLDGEDLVLVELTGGEVKKLRSSLRVKLQPPAPFVEIKAKDLARVYEPGACDHPGACPCKGPR